MSKKQLKSPQASENAEGNVPVSYSNFAGQIKGDVPLSKIPPTHVYRHINAVGYGPWAEGDTGTRRYSKALLPETTFTADDMFDTLNVIHRYQTGDRVKLRSRGVLPDPLVENTVYYVIYVDDITIQLATSYANAIAGTAIDLTNVGTGTHFIRYAGELHGKLDHRKEKKILKHYGRRVYVAERTMDVWREIINCDAVDPMNVESTFAESGGAAVLAAGHIFRVVLDDANPDNNYMYRINLPVPNTMFTDIVESPGVNFGYRYVYGFCYITHDGIRNRLSEDSFLRLETGTCKDENEEKFYSELFFANAIGLNLTQDHILQYFVLPITHQHITHYSLYRTKNIGRTSGGLANNNQFFIWNEDVPVAKAISITVAADVATIEAGQAGFVRGDVGCLLSVDAAGTRTGIIESWVAANVVNLVAGHTLGATEDVAIGEGRVMSAFQGGLLCTRTAGDQFVVADEGRTIYWGDGGEGVIRQFLTADNVEMAVDAAHASQAATIQNDTGTFAFRRKWNDTLRDNGDAVAIIGISERMESARDIYIPNVNFNPVPSADIVVSDSGFTLFAMRDSSDYYYSNIGAKAFIEGQYRADHQFGKIAVSIRDIKLMPALAIFLCPTKTYCLALNVPIPNIGNEKVGEFIQKLTEAAEADGFIGVIHWKTIAFINASLFMAVTNEPAVRMFDGHQWSPVNYAIDQTTGLPAVMGDLNKIDSYYGLVAWYSYRGGYKLFAWKWQEV